METESSPRKKTFLEHRPNFIKVVSFAIGLQMAIAFLWMFGDYGGIGWLIFLAGVAFAVGVVSAYFMWFAFKSVYGINESKDEK